MLFTVLVRPSKTWPVNQQLDNFDYIIYVQIKHSEWADIYERAQFQYLSLSLHESWIVKPLQVNTW